MCEVGSSETEAEVGLHVHRIHWGKHLHGAVGQWGRGAGAGVLGELAEPCEEREVGWEEC